MSPEQFRNWRDFALRMARTCYAESRRPSSAWLVEQVQEFLDRVECEADTIVDWDSPPAYVCDSLPLWLEEGFVDGSGAPMQLAALPNDAGVWL